jgi:predicted ATPase
LRTTRQELHRRIAEALESLSPELIDSQPELFARHYIEAGLVERSVVYLSKAGQKSVARAAIVEAAAHFQKGLDQLALLPNRPEKQQQELEFCSALSAALRAAKGQGRLKRVTLMPARECFGKAWGFRRSSFRSPMGSRAFTRTAVNWNWRDGWTRICCV